VKEFLGSSAEDKIRLKISLACMNAKIVTRKLKTKHSKYLFSSLGAGKEALTPEEPWISIPALLWRLVLF
jgi:hypothetical protein